MYTINRNGEQFGPYDARQVVQLIAAGQLRGTDFAWSDKMDDWQPLACVPEFSDQFASKPGLIIPGWLGRVSRCRALLGFLRAPLRQRCCWLFVCLQFYGRPSGFYGDFSIRQSAQLPQKGPIGVAWRSQPSMLDHCWEQFS